MNPELTWLQKHEKIILGLALLLVSFFLFNKYLDGSSEKATVKAALAEATLQDTINSNKQILNSYNNLLANLSEENHKLIVAAATRNTQTDNQRKTDAALPLPELGQRWVHLLNLDTKDILFQPPGLLVSDPAAHKTVDQLELVPTLQINLQEANRRVENNEKLRSEQDKVVTGLNKQIEDQKKASGLEIIAVKAKARKSKRNWFVAGAVIGGAVIGYLLH